MKRFKFVIAAVLAICLVQGAWAVAPGGALGGGGKAAQQHPQQEGTLVSQPAQAAGPSATDVQQMETADITPTKGSQGQPDAKVVIGKPSSEGQAGNEFNEAEFSKIAAENARKKEVRRQLKQALKSYREAKKADSPSSPNDSELLLYVILAFLLPPLAVGLYMNGLTTEFWICLLLTILFYIPGLIYALIVILR
ncbi:MAG TPA: YqaE/Pmp3 family membrane protein [Bacteroidia bacterium]|nr:YqaE/Pmp3 family membrane protein [Bacteroidia bacterium]